MDALIFNRLKSGSLATLVRTSRRRGGVVGQGGFGGEIKRVCGRLGVVVVAVTDRIKTLAGVGFVGFPSVGKSTLLSNLAGVYSEVAA